VSCEFTAPYQYTGIEQMIPKWISSLGQRLARRVGLDIDSDNVKKSKYYNAESMLHVREPIVEDRPPPRWVSRSTPAVEPAKPKKNRKARSRTGATAPPAPKDTTAVSGESIEPETAGDLAISRVAGVRRVPSLDARLMAAYWQEALHYVDFAPFSSGPKADAPLDWQDPEAVAKLDASSNQEQDFGKTPQDVVVVLTVWRIKGEKPQQYETHHPLLAVPASYIEKKWFAARSDAAPVLNERYLSPDVGTHCVCLGDSDDANRSLSRAIDMLKSDSTLVEIGWSEWWLTCCSVILELLGVTTFADAESALGSQFDELLPPRKGDRAQWHLGAAVFEVAGAGTVYLDRVYRSLDALLPVYPIETGLFRRFCGGSNAASVAAMPQVPGGAVLAHMDEDDCGKRAMFPLDGSQRNAVRAILSLQPGEMQAVNGPPGSGKTAMLRALIASKWVSAAIREEPCPIIVACGFTNQSVRNVISAFGSIAGRNSNIPYACRWIPDAESYGAYWPSQSVRSDPDMQAELSEYVCLQQARNGSLFEYTDRINVLNPSLALDYEDRYLTNARMALGLPYLESVDQAVREVRERLVAIDAARRDFVLSAQVNEDALERAENYIDTAGTNWTAKRLKKAKELLADLQSERGTAAAHKLADLCWGAEAFHWAARYWEGMFLIAQRVRLFDRHADNVEESLRRLCMLTPCLVSTLHMAPQWAAIDDPFAGPGDQRTHYFGLFDLLMVDESGQASPELAAAVFGLAKTAAVVGDMQQLVPIWNQTELAERMIAKRVGVMDELAGIVRSRRSVATGSTLGAARLVSRWKDSDDDGVSLRSHYRCKPSIIGFCNQLSYGGTLAVFTEENEDDPEPSLGWVAVEAEPKDSGGSLVNQLEADELVSWLVDRWPEWVRKKSYGNKPIQKTVAILTPYKRQADYIEMRFREVFAKARATATGGWPSTEDLKKVTIGTVHRLQGAEFPVVVFSLVEGPRHGARSFIDQDRRMFNVAVSRAKASFLIFANPTRLFPLTETYNVASLPPSRRFGAYLRALNVPRLYPQQVVIIEAPGKLKTLSTILGKKSSVVATGGALWSLEFEGGVDVGAGFVPKTEPEKQTMPALARIAEEIATVDRVILATDNDRMGEYIAWQATLQLPPSALEGKKVRRARLGSITGDAVRSAIMNDGLLDDRRVMAEAVREVVDRLITQRHRAAMSPVNRIRPTAEETKRLVDLGACSGQGHLGESPVIGRVMAAVLRLILNRARATDGMREQRRVTAGLKLGAHTVVGVLYRKSDGKDVTSATNAGEAIDRLKGCVLQMTCPPYSETMQRKFSGPGTLDILEAAWRAHGLMPWETMESLQSLYTGEWSKDPGKTFEPRAPILPPSTDLGHPPLTPVDRAASPEEMRPFMAANDHAVYSLIWSFFTASEATNVIHRTIRLDYQIVDPAAGLGSQAAQFCVKFEGSSWAGIPADIETWIVQRYPSLSRQSAESLKLLYQDIQDKVPVLKAEPALAWDLTMDRLLVIMADRRIGRPSTTAGALFRLYKNGLLEPSVDRGPVRLTAAGLAAAITLDAAEPELSSPEFSAKLGQTLDKIERGQQNPREALTELMPALAPKFDPVIVGPKIWNSLAELEKAMRSRDSSPNGGSLVTAPLDEPLTPSGLQQT
jgi:DNA topoisomerase IA